jgi:Nucleotidyl transferase of unknown function (DUF2204)
VTPSVALFPDFRDMLAELSRARAEFVVVGGFAVSSWGYLRTTKDLDVFVRPSPENAARVLAALARFGAPLHDITAEDLAAPGIVFQIGVPPRRIDIVTAIDGVDFDEAVREQVLIPVHGATMPVIGLAALLRNKRATGRPEDKKDVRELTRIHRTPPVAKAETRKMKSKPKSKPKPRR